MSEASGATLAARAGESELAAAFRSGLTLKPQASSLKPRQSGFTLLELLVVIVIIGIMVAMATLSTSLLGRDSAAEDEARRLWAVLAQAREDSELQGVDTGVFVHDGGYEMLRFDGRRNLWLPIEYDRLYAPRTLPEGLRFRAWLDSREIILEPGPVERSVENTQGEQPTQTEVLAGVALQTSPDANKYPPQLVVLSSGDFMPFELQIEREGKQALWRVRALPDNDLRVERRAEGSDWEVVAQTRQADEEEDGRLSQDTMHPSRGSLYAATR